MKQSPEFDRIQDQMKPGVIALDGFLGDDKRKLVDIIASDNMRVRKLNRAHADIAAKMIHFKERGIAGLGEFITLDDHFEVKVESVRGLLPSPFGGPGYVWQDQHNGGEQEIEPSGSLYGPTYPFHCRPRLLRGQRISVQAGAGGLDRDP